MANTLWLSQSKKLTSSGRVGSEFTPKTGTESSMKWLACNRVPSPPTVITRSTSRMGCDRLLRTRAFHSTGLRRKIFWQKFIASLCTFCLLSKCCSWRNQFKINCISWKKVPQPRHILQNRCCDLKFVSYTIIKPKLLWGKNLEYLKCHHLFWGMKYTYLWNQVYIFAMNTWKLNHIRHLEA